MKPTRTTVVPLAAAFLAMGAVPSTAAVDQSPTTRTHQVVITSTARVLKANADGTAVLTGKVKGTLGKGAVVSRRATDGSRDEKSRGTMYFAKGSMRGTSVLEIEPSGGRIAVAGHLKVTGGTGRYTGARGRLKVEGTADPKTQLLRLTVKGKVTY